MLKKPNEAGKRIKLRTSNKIQCLQNSVCEGEGINLDSYPITATTSYAYPVRFINMMNGMRRQSAKGGEPRMLLSWLAKRLVTNLYTQGSALNSHSTVSQHYITQPKRGLMFHDKNVPDDAKKA